MAGHYVEAADLLVDTHGADVIDPVWALLDATYRIHGVAPTLLEAGALAGRAAPERIAIESRHPDPALILQTGGALLDDLRARGAILGTRHPGEGA